MDSLCTLYPLPVRHNQTLDYEGLRAEAKAAASKSGKTQVELAALFGVTQPAVSQALNRAGAKHAALQQQIISALTGFSIEPVEPVITFRVVSKAA